LAGCKEVLSLFSLL